MNINKGDLKSYISHLKKSEEYIDKGNTLEAKELIQDVIKNLEYDIRNG
jgi:hypothetical protein